MMHEQNARLQQGNAKAMATCTIMGVNIAVTDMESTLQQVEAQLESWRGGYICVANVHTTVTAYEDESYRAIQNNAVMALPDGGPLSKYSRAKGFAQAQRVTGPDFMRRVLAESAAKGWRHYFYGSTQESLDKLRQSIETQYPGVAIAGMLSPPFRPLTPQEDATIVENINATHPDFVWVGLGAPKQERWMAAHENRVHALMVGVGAAFDYEAGNIRRAPAWMQRHNLEWLYRLLQDPKRLFKRYLNTNLKYLLWTWRH
ncbi:MAG: WecB/TagA/CpsF family glycosyltransferase [Gemmiger sp.]|nr:WecB/TagA/CpsF family glycosyltransferase [Gemmiger sp.]